MENRMQIPRCVFKLRLFFSYVPAFYIGRFPVFSNCSQFYECDDNLIKTTHNCSGGRNFDPLMEDCSKTYRCIPSTDYYIARNDREFPPCLKAGTFRLPDCSYYYKCIKLKKSRKSFFIQKRFK